MTIRVRLPSLRDAWFIPCLTQPGRESGHYLSSRPPVEDVSSLPLEGWRVDAEMAAAHNGYINQSLVLWGPGGVPVALGRQTMVVFG